jgi:16S rRNA (cytosine967-C5)-methyltransferase
MIDNVTEIADTKLAAQIADGGRLRALVLELWQRTRMDWGFVTDRLAMTFRRETWIGSHERRFVGETLYGLVRHLRRVDTALARGRHTSRAPRDLERLLALLVLDKLIEPARAAKLEPDLDWRAVATVDDAIAAERRPVTRIALAASLPDWLAQRLVNDWGDEAESLALALNRRAPMTVRANLLITDRDALAAELAPLRTTPGKWCDTALAIDDRTNLFALEAFKRGAFEAQDEGSQLLADLVTGKTIIDLCAGAGGKTLAIAARHGNRGRIVAADVDAGKLDELRRRARRAKVTNAQAVHVGDGRWPRELDALRGKADIVLVDAPCSGIGALRRNPEARWRLREADLATFAAKQRELVASARHLCAPGGRIVYATCTVVREENQAVVASVLASHPELVAVPLREVWGERAAVLGDGEVFTVTPHRHGTDGFFARVLEVSENRAVAASSGT